ncbi:MAG TPA: GNAT family N-acetyltransferase [Rhizomicrobium sp.]|jgi:translation initiation factor 4G|nr:GNAT family N-acetyltransferase [Rhizomicrobium sp.]
MVAPVIRPATRDDADFLAWTIFVASRGHLARGWFDIMLDRPEAFCLDFCRRLVLADAVSWWHWSLFHVAEMDGAVASALCVFGGDGVYQASSAAMTEASRGIGLSKDEHQKLWPRGSFIMSTVTGEDDAWTVENVATLPRYRGQGAVQALIARGLDAGRAAGFKRAQISFLIGNDAAERAYAKAGFVFAEEKRAPEFEAAMGTPGVKRFARDI